MAQTKPASTFIPSRSPIVELSSGMATWSFIKILQEWDTKLSNGLNSDGLIIGDIPPSTQIIGRTAIGDLVRYIDDGGIVQPTGLPAATDSMQGAVVLSAGAPNNQLGSAALQPSTAFDSAGSAAAAQTNAETFASAAANTAQSNAQAFAGNASNLSSGTVNPARLPASVAISSFGTGVPGGTSTEGYLYFDTTGAPYHGYVFHAGAWHQFS